jgi:lipopolysaccharide/colanic/teichoic acid biosynthesis glycosyltransferase
VLDAFRARFPSVSPERFDAAFDAPAIRAQLLVKAALDRAVATAVLTALGPALLGVGVAIRLDSEGPALFWQERVGRDGRVFRICKFRTMRPPRPDDASEDDRVSKLGRFLRLSSIDEIPQLVNVVRGEMSLVGPRPFLPKTYAHFDERLKRTFRMKPGITGWAQVGEGRNAQSWDEKFERNLYYVEHFSLILDLEILLKTIGVVLGQQGVGSSPGSTVGVSYSATASTP